MPPALKTETDAPILMVHLGLCRSLLLVYRPCKETFGVTTVPEPGAMRPPMTDRTVSGGLRRRRCEPATRCDGDVAERLPGGCAADPSLASAPQ